MKKNKLSIFVIPMVMIFSMFIGNILYAMEYNSGVDKNDQYADGVDLSEWNKSNNLKKAKNDGIQFVIIRSSFGYSDYGFQHKGYDLYFEENYKKATQAGLLIGIYHYSYARTIEQAKQEAKRTLKVINGRKLELPIFYDVEDRSLLSNDDGVDNKQFVTDKILAYINIIQQAGYRAGVYANLNWFTNYIDTSRLPKNCDLWIAHYNKNLFESNKALYKGKYSIWQYASNGYKVDGITNFGGGIKNVDVNIAYKDYGNPKQNGWVRNWNDTDDQNTKKEIWHLDNTGWWYENADGSYPKDEWKKINGKWYHFKKDGYMSKSQWIGNYYVGTDGAMLVNTTTPDGYKVDENGKWKKETASWKRNNIGWWYENADGSYPQSEWKKINGSWYYFGNNGYMLESQWIGNYYVGSNGAMLVNTTTPDGYEVDENGKWIEERQAMWKKNNTGWWYENADGSYPKDEWKKINGSWYYFGNNGYMLESQWIGNYYVGSNGAMLVNTTTPDGYKVDENGKWIEERQAMWKKNDTGWWYENADGSYPKDEWKKINGSWYYFGNYGYMLESQWIGNYYVGSNGAMLVNTTTPDGYEVDENGKWI